MYKLELEILCWFVSSGAEKLKTKSNSQHEEFILRQNLNGSLILQKSTDFQTNHKLI